MLFLVYHKRQDKAKIKQKYKQIHITKLKKKKKTTTILNIQVPAHTRTQLLRIHINENILIKPRTCMRKRVHLSVLIRSLCKYK